MINTITSTWAPRRHRDVAAQPVHRAGQLEVVVALARHAVVAHPSIISITIITVII